MEPMNISLSEISTMKWPFDRDVDFFARQGVSAMGVVKSKLEAYGIERGVKLLRDSGLTASCLQTSDRFSIHEPAQWPGRLEALYRSLELAANLEAKSLVLLTGPYGDVSYEQAADRFLDQARQVVPEAARLDVPLALEPHLSVAIDASFVHRLEDTLDLADEVDSPWFGVNFEITHCFMERRLYQNIRSRVARIVHVQAGDYRMGTRSAGDRAPLGDGCIPLAKIFAALQAAGYQGYYEIETHGPQVEALGYEEALRRSLAFLERYRSQQEQTKTEEARSP